LEQRVYTPPAEPEPFQPPQVTAAAAPTVNGTPLEEAHNSLLHAKSEFEKHIAATLENAKHYTPEGLKHQLDAFQNTAAAKGVDAAEQQIAARRDQAQAEMDKVYRDLSPNGDAAAESRATRFWNRTERLLDSVESGERFGVAQELVKSASREELGTLLQELPAYLKSCGVTTDWIDTVVGQAVPEYASAKAQLKKADAAVQIVRQNANSIRRAFADGRANGVVIADPFTADKYNRYRYDPDGH
jgi:hypothetical protein